MQSSHEDLFFSIFLSGCKQPKSIHILFSAAKVRLSERKTKLVWDFPSERTFGGTPKYEYVSEKPNLFEVFQSGSTFGGNAKVRIGEQKIRITTYSPEKQ